MNKTIPMELRYHKHHIYTSADFLELVVVYNRANISYYKINENGEIIEHNSNLTSNPCLNQEENYYYLDYASLPQLQALDPLRQKFDLTYVIHNLTFVRDFFNLRDVSLANFSMDHANIITDTMACLKQLNVFDADESYVISYNKLDNICDNYLMFPKQELDEERKKFLFDELSYVINILEHNNAEV